MIKVHLAIGVTDKSRLSQLLEEGVEHVLFSFSEVGGNPKKVQSMASFPSLMLDSGGFSHGNTAIESLKRRDLISVKEHFESYCSFLQMLPYSYPKVAPKLKVYVNFDDMSNPELTLANQKTMEDAGLHPMPVYHFGEDKKYLDYYCSKYELVGLGGLAVGQVSTGQLRKWWNKIAIEHKDNKFHVLGTSQFRAFVDHEPYSLDSTSWLTDAWGNLLTIAKDGGPAIGGILQSLNSDEGVAFGEVEALKSQGVRKTELAGHFFTVGQLRSQNIKAMLYFGKMEWIKPKSGEHQASMFDFLTEEVS